MTHDEILEKLNEVFRDVFDDESIEVNDSTVSSDIDGWDSLEHINLIAAVQEKFQIRFPMKQVQNMQNVGDMVKAIESLLK